MYKKLEEYSLNAWPALQQMVYDGWLLRFADGYTKRSNSINPIYEGELKNLREKIESCESVYVRTGLNPIFKITPFVTPPTIDQTLEEMGYRLVEPSSVQLLPLSILEEPTLCDIVVSDEINDDWLDVISCMNGMTASEIEITKRMLSRACLQQRFFILYAHSIPVACGLGVIEQNTVGLLDIVTDPQYRRRGYGKQLILHILKWAKSNGATHSYLQVVKCNVPAIQLYRTLGFREVYSYWYRIIERDSNRLAAYRLTHSRK